MYLYRVDDDVLETLGPTLLHSFQVEGQVEAMDCALVGRIDPPTLVVACGTAAGHAAFVSYCALS